MADQNYEPIAPVNTNINGDDANKFAVKYKKEVENIYKLLRGIVQGNGGVVVDEALSATSPNPVENRAITARLNNMYTKSEITQMLAALSGGGSGGAYGEANSYKVTITQSEHQYITVRKYLAASSTLYRQPIITQSSKAMLKHVIAMESTSLMHCKDWHPVNHIQFRRYSS